MAKTEQNACLSTSQSFPTAPPLPVIEERVPGENKITMQTPEQQQQKKMMNSRRPDYFLVSCYVIIYLELGWLILMLLRTYSRH